MYRISLILVFLFLAISARAAIFTVTSGADAGSGTLREALSLAAANGVAETDYIYFSLTAGKISTTSPLILSSSLVIDGTSFPGAKLGVSDAKVTIETLNDYVSSQTGAFNGTNINHVEIYGLCFSNFGSGQRGVRTINITVSTDITIGAVGKGNIFLVCDYDIYMFKTNRIKISSNWFGITADKTTVTGTAFGGTVDLRLCDNIMLGGETKAEGNSWGYRYYGVIISGVNPTTQAVESVGELCVVKNNNFGMEEFPSGVENASRFQDFKKIEIVNNNVLLSGGFSLKNISVAGVIQGNRIGLKSDMTKAYCYSMLELENCNNIKIGGKNSGEANVMAYRVNFGSGTSGIYATNCGDVLLERNSIYCVSASPILYNSINSKVEIPKIAIVGYNNGVITGTASPNAEIEVFSDGECLQCEAKTYLNIKDNKTLYMTYAFSECESERAAIPIAVVQNGIEIPNAFTPNNDGVNDKWIIKNIAQFPKARVTIFNRNGVVVFTSNGYDIPFDGTKSGKLLTAGTYYYVIKLGADCKEISGSLFLLQ